MAKKKKLPDNTIAVNRKARHEYHIDDDFEAGIVLEGWEVKSIREGRIQMVDSHIVIRQGEAWLVNTNITPLSTASTHIKPNATRSRKLLLHKEELNKLIGKVERKGATLIPLNMYWKKNKVKLKIALATGKKLYDKREDLRKKAVARDSERAFKRG